MTHIQSGDDVIARELRVGDHHVAARHDRAHGPGAGDQPVRDEDLGADVGPFMMAVINTKNVHRSNFLMGHPYGANFVYDEMVVAGHRDRCSPEFDRRTRQDRRHEQLWVVSLGPRGVLHGQDPLERDPEARALGRQHPCCPDALRKGGRRGH